MALEQFCLKWNDHQSVVVNNVDRLLQQKSFVDCTLAAEGQFVGAHKVILSACSPYFEALLSHHTEKHPIFILKDIKFEEVKAIMSYMYRGEVIIPYDKLAELLRAAESLQVKGLGEKNYNKNSELNGSPQQQLQQQLLQQQKTPVRSVVQTTTRVRSGGSGERRVTQPSAEVVDLTDEPQRPARLPKSVIIQRTSPYPSKKYARKLDYQTASQRVIQRTDSSPSSDPNSSGLFISQNAAVVRTAVSGSSTAIPQTVTQGSSNLQQMSSFASTGQYPASNISPTSNRQRASVQQILSSIGPVVQVTSSPVQNILQQQKSSVAPGVTHRAPIVPQHAQTISSQFPVSSDKEPSHGLLLSAQSSQQPTVQQSKIHLPSVQSSKINVSSVQAPKLTSVLPSQAQLLSGQPSQVQLTSVDSPQAQPVQIESPRVDSPSQQPSLAQRISGTHSNSDIAAESQEKVSLPLENYVANEDSSQSMDFDNLHDSAQSLEEDKGENMDESVDKVEENLTTKESASNQTTITKARRGRPIGVDHPFKCPECGKLFTQKSNMEKHRRIHTGEYLKCDMCDKSFVGRNSLIRHLRKHETKKDHKCQICGMMFSSTKALEDHLTQHASTSSSDQ